MFIGYIKIHRQFLETSFYGDSAAVHLALTLLVNANYKTTTTFFNGEGVTVKRGQLITGRQRLSDQTSLKMSTVRNKLGLLVRTGFLTIKSTNRYSLITICKYNDYQDKPEDIGQQTGQPEDNQRTATGQQLDTSKEGKEGKEVKNKYSPTSQEVRLASYLFEKILNRSPSHKKPDLDKWASVVDKIIRVDKRSPGLIEEVIDWCQKDSFWQNNILSPTKLRKQFDQLVIKMKAERSPAGAATPPKKACKDCGTTKWTAFTDGRCEDCYQNDLAKY